MNKSICALVSSVTLSLGLAFAASVATAAGTRTLDCSPFGMNQFSGTVVVTNDHDAHITSDISLTLSSVTRVTSPNETANPNPKLESFIDNTMTGEIIIVPKGQLMVDETTVLTLNREAGADKASLRIVLGLPMKNAKLTRNGVIFEALCTDKPVQQP